MRNVVRRKNGWARQRAGVAVACAATMLALPAAAPVVAQPAAPSQPTKELSAERQAALYAMGVMLVQRTALAETMLSEAELREVVRGFADAKRGKASPPPGPAVARLIESQRAKRGAKNRQQSEQFVVQAAQLPGAKTLQAGVVLTTASEGKGAAVGSATRVQIQYRGTLADGREFDSSYKRNVPLDVDMKNTLPCWAAVLPQLRVGSKARVVCSDATAYGDKGMPPLVPPGTALAFELEVVALPGGKP